MNRFCLHRIKDISGVSGCGIIAEGVQFTDGTCVLRWLTSVPSTAFYANIRDLLKIHGHDGATCIVFEDGDYDLNMLK